MGYTILAQELLQQRSWVMLQSPQEGNLCLGLKADGVLSNNTWPLIFNTGFCFQKAMLPRGFLPFG